MTNELQLINERLDLITTQLNKTAKLTRLNDSLFSPELAPHYSQLAVKLANTDMVPKAYAGKPANMFLAMAMGYQLGLSVEQSIQGIGVLNGKPCIYGDALLAVVMNHKDFQDIVECSIIENDAVVGARCTVKRRNRTDTVRQFTLKDAKKAGLLGKPGPWTQYTERMLQMRARGWACRDAFPDALQGISTAEEVQDYIEGDYSVVQQTTKGLSRTEELKQQLTKKESTNETIEHTLDASEKTQEGVVVSKDIEPSLEAVQDKEQAPMVEDRQQDTSPHDEDYQYKKVNLDRINEITQVIDDIQITQERLQKALQYYQVKHIAEMTNEMADDFLKRIRK